MSDEDCAIARDCCTCHAVPAGQSFVGCDLACEGTACDLQGVAAVATCSFGRCAVANCSALFVTCNAAPPTCPAGQTASVAEDGCWGPCIASTECSYVTDCDACGDADCVTHGGLSPGPRCLTRPPTCETGSLCECHAPCGSGACDEQDGQLYCPCPGC